MTGPAASYQILDTPREAVFDAFTHIAAQMAGVRMAALSFFEGEREWYKACTGADLHEMPMAAGFGRALAEAGAFLEVPDAARDERFSGCALVRGETQVRFYAGVPLRTPQGDVLGAFCVMSRIPRSLTPQQRSGLTELAGTVMAALETRRRLLSLFAESSAAQEQIALLLSAIDVAGDVILVYRVDPQSGELVLNYMNEAYTRQTGYTREEALGRPLYRFRHAMPDDPGMTKLREAIRRGRPALLEIVSYRKDGSSFWNQVTMHPIRDQFGAVSHWITVERDVSEAVERESKREDQHARLLLLTAAARQLFGTLDVRTLIARTEEAARQLLGGTALVHAIPQAPERFGDPLLARAAGQRGHVADESRFRAAASAASAGPPKYVLELRAGSGRTLRADDLFVLDLLAEYFGVAARNAALIEEIEERRSAILELNQVKTDLIAMLAHDFKSPLTSIVGFSELAMELGPVNADQREFLESIKKIALRLADLASDTLAFSQLERNEIDLSLSDVDLAALAKEAAESLADQRAVGVRAFGACIVRGDEHRLRQVIYNLVENAIKYSPGGEPVDVTLRATAGRVRLSVVDRGIGIPKKDLEAVFGRFSRGSNARALQIAGSGFGLFLARQIVELHGGTIAVSSTEGKGSTFTVDLPVAGNTRAEQPLCVLVAVSEREARSFSAHALREAGFRVCVAHTAADLFEQLDAERIDRVLIDRDDVELNAAEIARLEQAQRERGFEIVAVGHRPGGFERSTVLRKPFLVQDLLSAIRSHPP